MSVRVSFSDVNLVSDAQRRQMATNIAVFGTDRLLNSKDIIQSDMTSETLCINGCFNAWSKARTELEKQAITDAYIRNNQDKIYQRVESIIKYFSSLSVSWLSTVSYRAAHDERRKMAAKQPNKLAAKLSLTPYTGHCIRWLLNDWPMNANQGWPSHKWDNIEYLITGYLRAKNSGLALPELQKFDTTHDLRLAVEPFLKAHGLWHTQNALRITMVPNLPAPWQFDDNTAPPGRPTNISVLHPDNFTIAHLDDHALIVKLNNSKAASIFGHQTDWCTAYTNDKNRFDDIPGSLYFIALTSGERYQVNLDTGQYRDHWNEQINLSALIANVPPLYKILEQELHPDLTLQEFNQNYAGTAFFEIVSLFRDSPRLSFNTAFNAYLILSNPNSIKSCLNVLLSRADYRRNINDFLSLNEHTGQGTNGFQIAIRHIAESYAAGCPLLQNVTPKRMVNSLCSFYPAMDNIGSTANNAKQHYNIAYQELSRIPVLQKHLIQARFRPHYDLDYDIGPDFSFKHTP